jgi:hypothetical protein
MIFYDSLYRLLTESIMAAAATATLPSVTCTAESFRRITEQAKRNATTPYVVRLHAMIQSCTDGSEMPITTKLNLTLARIPSQKRQSITSKACGSISLLRHVSGKRVVWQSSPLSRVQWARQQRHVL